MNYIFSNIIGSFILDDKGKIIDEILFNNAQEFQNKEKNENKLSKKHQAKPLQQENWHLALKNFRDPEYFHKFYERNLELTKQAVKDSVGDDLLIMQTISNFVELDQTVNLLTKRLREWYSLYLPELSEKISSHEMYVDFVEKKSKKELLKELKISVTMGADLETTHVEEIILLAKQIKELNKLKEQHEVYLEKIMKKYCPNLLELAGTTIGAKLVELGRGLKHLAMLPASTIQLLGAEKALFRHIKTGSRSPKYGVIFQHPLIQNAPRKIRGKVSRVLADKLSLCVRLDFFKGEFKAKEYRKTLEEKFQ